MIQKSRSLLPKVQQTKLQKLQVDVEALWKQVQDLSEVNPEVKVDSAKAIALQNQQHHSQRSPYISIVSNYG